MNTHKRNIYWKRTHICEKIDLRYVTAKSLQYGRENKGIVECAVEKDSHKKKKRESPMQQERTKTQNCTKEAKIARKKPTQPRNNDDICEYGSYVYMMIIIIGLLWARKKCSTKSKPR